MNDDPEPRADSDDGLPYGDPVPRATRPWVSVALGASTGLLAAAAGILVWTLWHQRSGADLPPPHETATVELFRLPSGGAREAMLVPAGPDAIGEPRLSAGLFPGETPPRELASLLLANVSPAESWDVDLAREPLRCRVDGGAWEDLDLLAARPAPLAPADDVRFRALGGGETHVRIDPGNLRQVLVALPPRRKMSDLAGVEWGGRPLTRDRLALDRIRRFREDPAAAVTGR